MKAKLAWLAALAGLLLVTGCNRETPSKLVGACEMRAREVFPKPIDQNDGLYDKAGPAADYVVACMKTKGFEYHENPDSCPTGDISSFEGRCYRKAQD
jgi:hypothetical protein